jgi:invasion protein IalB
MALTTPLSLPLAALALALMPVLAGAQTTEAPATEAPATEAPAPGSAPATDLSLGQETPSGLGETYVKAAFEAWEQRCIRTESGVDPCQLYQLLKDQTGNPVAEITVFGLPAGTQGPAVAGANFIAPLETLLTAGLELQVDAGTAKTYPFSTCNFQGCIARVGLTAEEMAAMRAGAVAKLTIVPFVAPDQRVVLEASLKGFTAGMKAVDEANAAADALAAEAAKAAGGN